MLYKSFLEQLGKTPRRWFASGGRLRLVQNFSPLAQCPISAVCTELTGTELIAGDWDEAASLIGLDSELAAQIRESADDGVPSYGFYSEKIRKDLLEAVGLFGGEK